MRDGIMAMVEKIRHDWGASDAARDAMHTTPDDVKRYDNIPYGTDNVWQSLDVYRPRGASIALPVIISVHGGGWIYGTKEVYQFYCMDLCRRGFVVVNSNYRLAPEHPFPAQLEDTASVFAWTVSNAARYGIDTNRVYAVGDSAGAHILALFAAMWSGKRRMAGYDISIPPSLHLKAVGLNCGAYSGPKGDIALAVTGGAEDALAVKHMNVIPHIGSHFPPTFCMTSTGDMLKHEAVLLFRRLVQKNVPCECRLYGTADNRLPHVFHVDITRNEAAVCNDDTAAWFNRWR